MATPTELDDYLFDLRGYLVLQQALAPDLVDELNTALDDFPALEPQAWAGNVHRVDDNPGNAGVELQNIVEGGPAFERLIDHPSWLAHVRRYCGEKDSYVKALFTHKSFAVI